MHLLGIIARVRPNPYQATPCQVAELPRSEVQVSVFPHSIEEWKPVLRHV